MEHVDKIYVMRIKIRTIRVIKEEYDITVVAVIKMRRFYDYEVVTLANIQRIKHVILRIYTGR